ncbi:MAG: bifunctional phosphoglucose/phosphomannose isomerase [Fimbriimonadaceae bacterium]|nr:bifunctional phosphoglucose/phosphomannose isomerase [Fimbriimonadaceae bacterium]
MAHILDDRDYLLRNDPKGMYRLTCEFPDQCRKALDIAQKTTLQPLKFDPSFVVLSGLGGSAIGGDFLSAIIEDQGSVPFQVNRDYSLPNCVDSGTLLIASSYSGNTEETLSAYAIAKAKGATILATTSGGKLAELARADGFDVIQIPGGQPPRTALGYSLVPALVAAESFRLIPPQPFAETIAGLEEVVRSCAVEVPFEQNQAKQIAAQLHGKLSVIYGLGSWQGVVAYRWKGQINENAKNMTFSARFPELNHNEVLGWVKATDQGVGQWVVVVLKDGTESAKMQARGKITLDLIGDRAEHIVVQAKGDSLLEKALTLTLLGDFVSLYLATLNDVDPENIDWLNHLKGELANIPN